MIINLNTLCKVKLSELGKAVWLAQIDALPEDAKSNPEIIANIKNQIDSDDCIELELWAIMNVFGRYISPVNSPFRTTTLEINKNPNFGNFFKKEVD